MKNQSSSRLKSIFHSLFRVRAWSDWNRTQTFSMYIQQMFQRLFVFPKKGSKNIIFEEAVLRQKVTDEQLINQVKDLDRLCLIMILVSFFVLIYVVYQCVFGVLIGVLLSLIVWMIALTLTFRYSYWSFVIQRRNFKSSLREWFQHSVLRKKI